MEFRKHGETHGKYAMGFLEYTKQKNIIFAKNGIWIVIGICLLPSLLNCCGLNFGGNSEILWRIEQQGGLPSGHSEDFWQHFSCFRHTTLLWLTFFFATIIGLISLIHYHFRGNLFVFGLSNFLILSAFFDGLQAIMGDSLMIPLDQLPHALPLLWTAFQALAALLILAWLGVIQTRLSDALQRPLDIGWPLILTGIILLVGIGLVSFCLHQPKLPDLLFPNAIIPRPYDLLPLFLYVGAAIWLYFRLIPACPNFFGYVFLIAIIPNIFAEMHMCFGSAALYDNYFHIAHFLKTVTPAVCLFGFFARHTEMNAAEKDRQASEEQYRQLAARQTQLLKELGLANDELKSFAHVVSHDLKAPLRGIANLSDWLLTDYADRLGPDGRKNIELIISQVKKLQNMIQGILEYSQVGVLAEAKIPIELNSLVEEVIALLVPPAHIRIQITTPLPTVIFEKTRLFQVFQNLLANAINFMDKPQGEVTISCEVLEKFWRFCIADNGPGIEPRYQTRIFQLFHTIAPQDKHTSSGVGLSIVKKIINLYGGEIGLESEPGQGSRFYFSLPR
jgi:signal transduction histidine kinase